MALFVDRWGGGVAKLIYVVNVSLDGAFARTDRSGSPPSAVSVEG